MKTKSNSIKDIREYIFVELQKKYSADEIKSLTNILFEEYCKINSAHLLAFAEEKINESELLNIVLATEQLKKEKPIQQILKKTYFYNLCININENVLIPRQETEELCHKIVALEQKLSPNNIIDLCTGSGCIALALKNNLPKSKVFAMDVSCPALLLAKQNGKQLDLDINFVQGDLLGDFDIEQKFDVIVSNPPYVMQKEKILMKNNVLKYEPNIALFVEDENPLVFYQKIKEFAQKHLKSKGRLYLEINENLSIETSNLFSDTEYIKEIKQDVFGKERFIFLEKK
ncbi:MAG: peptide chain release factor N(5)-glutamine methyltransferase [Bacteroidota bacterium]|nr:peptide chain release factor N(5)-glutamine methyltransferase [Bacteroidota bacterium]